MKTISFYLFGIVFCGSFASPLIAQKSRLFSIAKGEVTFSSEAPLERITATNTVVSGILDISARNFVVKIPMRNFEGFNSALQQEHFFENYVETKDFPNALFEGRIIEACDLASPATFSVRAKGRFTLHGVVQERVVNCTIVVTKEGVRVTSVFDVQLAEHGIRVPRVVQQKLASMVKVKVDLLFSETAEK
ncbi:MAG: YceI family protein [Flavobacteriales bacterium]|nr:YceI family protein [Flavobacteriales bacterium]